MQPQRVLLSREGSDADHQVMHDVPAVLPGDPQIGDSLQLWTEDGKMIRTSIVRRVSRSGSQIIVDTENSRYRLQLPS